MRRIFVLLTLMMAGAASVAEDDAKLGRIAWSAFQCHQWAANMADEGETERFFNLGLDASRKFLQGLQDGTIKREEASKYTPIGITMVAQGPTIDFIIARIYSFATQEAYDDIAKEKDGLKLAPEKWVTDRGLIKTIAATKFQNANCELIQ